MRSTELSCQKAADHIYFITVCCCYNKISGTDTCLNEQIPVGSVSGQAKNVKAVLQFQELFLISLYCDYLMTFLGELFNEYAADLNNDGSVNIDDVTSLINYLLSDDSSQIQITNADIDGDDDITISDVTALIGILLN